VTATDQTITDARTDDTDHAAAASPAQRRGAKAGAARVPDPPGGQASPGPATDEATADAADAAGGAVVQELPIDKVHPARDNPRGKDIGNVDELAASIAQVGVLQPVTVAPRGRRYLLVYGHRRLAATRQAGLPTIPAIVQPMSEVERITRQTIENHHRQDLTPLQDAAAIANLRDAVTAERDGTTPGQRELARMLGVSQSHVSKRLELLELPKAVRVAVADGGITLDQAEELHKLVAVGQPKEAEQLARQQLNGELRDFAGQSRLAEQVKRKVDDAVSRARATAVRAELAAAGARVLEPPKGGWWSSPAARIASGQQHDERHCLWTGGELTETTVDEHAKVHPDGHAAALCERHGEAVWLCTDATAHAETEDKAAARAADRQADGQADQQQRDQERQLGRAAKARQAFVVELLQRPVKVHASDRALLTDVVLMALERQESEAAKLTCRLLGLEPVLEQPTWTGGKPTKNHREAVRHHAEDPANLGRVARALPWAEGEFRARWTYSSWGRLVLRYLDQLVAAGYALSPAEQERYQQAQQPDDAHDQDEQPADGDHADSTGGQAQPAESEDEGSHG
jgi:ParB/RepB/Spo0J family partition protein